MKHSKIFVVGLFALLSAALAATSVSLVLVCRKVRALESMHGGDVFAFLEKRQLDERAKAAVAAAVPERREAAEPKKGEPPVMRVEGFSVRNRGRTVAVSLSCRPDMEVIRSYVSVDPAPIAGKLSFSYDTLWDHEQKKYQPGVLVSGEFAYRTNLTLRVRRGLPCLETGDKPRAEGALAQDAVYAFQRPDEVPFVGYADSGRYLPPGGARALGVEALNVSSVSAEVWRVESRNIVQLLAREEGQYKSYGNWWLRPDNAVDCDETIELSNELAAFAMPCRNRPNEKEKIVVPVCGGGSNGVYLVSVSRGDCPWPGRYRLVCVSDFALSVRENGTDSPLVWVTSLMKGVPLAGVTVEVYSKSNTKVMEGVTDARGMCRPSRVAKGEPFAVIATAADGGDCTFLALRDSMKVDETNAEGSLPDYLAPSALKAFVTTDRGIYRHGERILLLALVRDGRRQAPPPLPVELRLISPKGDVHARHTLTTDAQGEALHDGFSVPEDQPSGRWRLVVRTPGEKGVLLGEREIKVEEFAPPQIRVHVAADASVHPSNFAFTVSAEHLFGGPAHALACEGAVVFEDAPFAPARWKGWKFGNDFLSLKPAFRRLGEAALGRDGTCRFAAPLWAESGLPGAAVRATGQGTVFEDGGRPATARATQILHYYPYYIGTTLGEWIQKDQGARPKIRIACVKPDGSRTEKDCRLSARLERIETVYSYRKQPNGWETWDCERVRKPVAEGLQVTVSAGEDAVFEIPADEVGDYALTVTDAESGVSFARAFYLGDCGDETVRAPLSNPTEVTIVPDKAFYRVGESPRLRVRAPFAGTALLSVMRDREVCAQVLVMTNATDEIALRPVRIEDAPNLNVFMSVVQSVEASDRHLAVRAHGRATVCVRPVEDEISVAVDAPSVAPGAESGSKVSVGFSAPGARFALVTLVDEGINLLTGEEVPDPVGCFARPCEHELPLYDLYHRILPVLGTASPRASGVKTGGGAGAEMLARVSPVPSRRFKPLALWSGRIPVMADGRGACEFSLPEFAGEVRVSVVAWSGSATGSAATRAKVTPKVIAQPDAPRFVAPGDLFEATLPLRNRSGGVGRVAYSIAVHGSPAPLAEGAVELADGGATNIIARTKANDAPGEMDIVYHVAGFGETHDQTIHLPVRPAVAWVETAGVSRGAASGRKAQSPFERCWEKEFDTPLAEYEAALKWLAAYPHGCLEQTASRIFPLIAAGGMLASVAPSGEHVVRAGVRRVESMVRSSDFVMWPDCSYAPWDREVSLYAAHFLVEAERSGVTLNPAARERVMGFLSRWAMSTNTAESAYACHTLALAGKVERDRMLRLYDASTNLTLLSRTRLARAFALSRDRPRAEALLAAAVAPSSVKETAFAVLALLETDPDDPRILPFVESLNARRDRARLNWGTTGENAHALLAVGEYFRHHPPKRGEKFVSWRRLSLPKPEAVRDESCGLSIARRYLTPEGDAADLSQLSRGEMVIAEIAISSDVSRELADLVVEDLLPACFEPIHGTREDVEPWVMRADIRDDRVLVFSKRFTLEKGREAVFRYPVRAVSAGDYALPGPSVEAMYFPALHARRAPGRIAVAR